MNVFHLRFSLVASVKVSRELLMQTCWWPLSDHWSVQSTSPHLSGFVFYGCLESLTELSALWLIYMLHMMINIIGTRKLSSCELLNWCHYIVRLYKTTSTWSLHQMDTFSALLTLCEGNPLVISGFPSQRPVKRSFDVFYDVRLNKRLSKQSRRWWYETPSRSLWRHCNDSGICRTRIRVLTV